MIRKTASSLLSLLFLLKGTVASPFPISSPVVPDAVKLVSPRQAAGETAPINDTVPPTSLAHNHKILCSGERYRRDLKGASCLDAVLQIPMQDKDVLFQTREHGPYDALLPTRFISADGQCIIEPVLEDNAESATASYKDISRAAYGLLYECAMRSSFGGIATDIGTDGKLGLIMTSYDPRVECHAAPSKHPLPTARCKRIIDIMYASTREKYFGNAGDRLAKPDIKLPRYLQEGTLVIPFLHPDPCLLHKVSCCK
ncbi:MAG: hypothetical protein Q9184_005804 [Pyrenodesmia sp. 2 TL-2023]